MTENTDIIEPHPAGLTEQELKSRRTITLIIYVLQALSFLVGISGIVAIIMNYVKRGDMRGTWLESHFRWQIRTFWYGLLWAFLGMLLMSVSIGVVVVLGNVVWVIYRIVRGVLALIENKPMYQ